MKTEKRENGVKVIRLYRGEIGKKILLESQAFYLINNQVKQWEIDKERLEDRQDDEIYDIGKDIIELVKDNVLERFIQECPITLFNLYFVSLTEIIKNMTDLLIHDKLDVVIPMNVNDYKTKIVYKMGNFQTYISPINFTDRYIYILYDDFIKFYAENNGQFNKECKPTIIFGLDF